MNMMQINGFEDYLTQHDSSAIRQFCSAARVEDDDRQLHEGGGEGAAWDYTYINEDMELWSSLDFATVDTFFNVEYSDKDKIIAATEEDENLPAGFPMMEDDVYYESNSTIMNEDIDLAFLVREEEEEEEEEEESAAAINGVDQGLQLVHLLLACAEAVGCRDARLADSILTQIWPRVTPWGDSLQRVSMCFAMGLKSRLSLLHNVNPNFSTPNFSVAATREEKIEALDLLHQTTPYIAFGFASANYAICSAAAGKESLHIIDLGMEHDNLQWRSLLNTLSLSSLPPKRIRITGFVGDRESTRIERGMGRLAGEAAALGISLDYTLLKEGVSPSTLDREKLEVREGEAVFVNSMMQLHKQVKESRGSLKAVLQSIKRLGPALVTVVEQDANHNGPFFLGRFLESLHYYSAIFDSLEAILSRESQERMKMERFHFSEEICNVVACEGGERVERHERADQWRRQLGRAGFQGVGLRCLDEAKMAVCGYGCDGYTVGSEKGCLQLGWKGRPIMVASAWQLHSSSSTS